MSSAKQRRKDRRQKALLNLGREAAVKIRAAEIRAESAAMQLSGLQADMVNAKNAAEAFAVAQKEIEAREEAHRQAMRNLKEDYEAKLQEQENYWCARLDAAKEKYDEALKKNEEHWLRRHEDVQAILRSRVAVQDQLIVNLKRELREPTKLRRRLQEKSEENARLQTELSQVRSQLVTLQAQSLVYKDPKVFMASGHVDDDQAMLDAATAVEKQYQDAIDEERAAFKLAEEP
jgi:regulator of replication initiation timing